MRTSILLLILFISPAASADSLDDAERKELRAYIATLKAGQPGSAVQAERLAAIPFDGLLEIIRAYTQLEGPVEPHTHRAFQALLERTSREALSPWPLVTLYSPDFARFLTKAGNPLASYLFHRLLDSGNTRQAFDLCVRLAPAVSLEQLAKGKKEKRAELFEAWNRRLALGREARPVPELEPSLKKVARAFSLDLPADELEAHLRFLASWPVLRDAYLRELARCLDHDRESIVLAGLAVQQRSPGLIGRNEALVARWPKQPRLAESALRNYAFDETANHSATLRKLWPKLPAEQVRLRYQALFAMSIHPAGNDGIALAVVRDQAFDLLDAALAVLRRGDPEKAKEAVKIVLAKSERGHEEALRLARTLKLTGFEDDALAIALDEKRDQILRQTAMLYLENAGGKVRRKLLPILASPKTDLRLTAIRTFKEKAGLSAEDLREIGPTLVRVAQADPSMGHRQEAMYVLGCWKAAQTMEFFRKLTCDNPAVILSDGYYSDARYWQYRFRLMGLLGQAKLGDSAAKKELLTLHAKGSPAEKMDVLLAFLDLGEVPDVAFADLESIEPRLVATAAQLIRSHGDTAAKERLKKRFASMPLWQEFRNSGIDDYNILRIAEGRSP